MKTNITLSIAPVLIAFPLCLMSLSPRSDAAEPVQKAADVQIAPAAIDVDKIDTTKLSAQERKYIDSFKVQIDFFALVNDQDGKPVADAKVRIAANDNPSMDGSARGKGSEYEAKTDANGRVAVTGMRGINIVVQVSKDGYHSMQGRSNALFTHGSEDATMNWRKLPKDASTPAVFVLKKAMNPEPLARLNYASVVIGKAGKAVEIDLSTGKIVPDGQGHIKVECAVEGDEKKLVPPYDWKCKISVPNGGLMPRIEDYDFVAPEKGYGEYEEIVMNKDWGRNWDSDAFRHYWVKTGNGKYARMNLRIITRGSGSCVFEESFFNPSGSRNLDVVPVMPGHGR